jgi:hypothetical protein
MGLISGLLLFPVTGPLHGLQFILEQIREQAEAELLDEGRIRAELVNLNMLRDLGEITDEEHAALEDALIEHLNMIRAYKEGQYDPAAYGEIEIDEVETDGADE